MTSEGEGGNVFVRNGVLLKGPAVKKEIFDFHAQSRGFAHAPTVSLCDS